MYLSINGNLQKEEDIKISIHDRSFLFGDNLFETILCRNNKLINLNEHLERLFNSAERVYIPILYSKKDIGSFVSELINKNNIKDSILRITLSRGIGDRGINIKRCNKPNFIITQTISKTISEKEYIRGKSIKIISTNKLSSSNSLNIKAGSLYIENILAKYKALNENFDDALMLDTSGNILECTTSNIFWLKNNVLYTPSLKLNILPGITRNTVIKIAKSLNIEFKEGVFKKDDIEDIEEVFITYSSAGIMPITKIDKTIISNNKIGKITSLLLKKFWNYHNIEISIYEN